MKNLNLKSLYFLALIIVVLGLFFILSRQAKQSSQISNNLAVSSSNSVSSTRPAASQLILTSTVKKLLFPIANAKNRITKKPFGLKVSPGHSPVSPEKFSGYHTGVDFETWPSEQAVDVPIYAVCDGMIVLKRSATGYGGVLVESCKLEGQSVTIIYGHLRLASIQKKISDQLKAGERFAVLGKGYSAETGGERKHLHLGIHLGSTINLLGYVQNKSDLKNWLNVSKYL